MPFHFLNKRSAAVSPFLAVDIFFLPFCIFSFLGFPVRFAPAISVGLEVKD